MHFRNSSLLFKCTLNICQELSYETSVVISPIFSTLLSIWLEIIRRSKKTARPPTKYFETSYLLVSLVSIVFFNQMSKEKRLLSIETKYKLSEKLRNNWRLRILGNEEIWEKSESWVETEHNTQSPLHKKRFGSNIRELNKVSY